MSRKPPNPAADRAAQNTQTIKSLLKLEPNKSCADCKRNKHPRWASWNLGIFICIRCSGIHRGMGTHISRVKSVDLDAWTDEQLQSVLKWGNARANKYWEAKLAPGHVPSEAKIENFIRTKYESKRWVMDGPVPDPSTLDAEGDDDIPLNLVKEKHNIEQSSSEKAASNSTRRVEQPDLFGDVVSPAARATTASPSISKPAPKSDPAPPKQTKPADSLLGLDFFGAPEPTNRPSSTATVPGTSGPSRPDLKQSILSLYASAPRPQQQKPRHTPQGSFSSAPPAQSTQPPQSSYGGLNDAFNGLSFSNPSSPPVQPQNAASSAFAGLGNISSQRSATQTTSPISNFGGGSFFDAKPSQQPPPSQPPAASRTFSSSSAFGAFDSAPGISPTTTSPPAASSGIMDLFDFSATSNPALAPQPVTSPPVSNSVFNLSKPQPPPLQPQPQASKSSTSGWNNMDAWGSNDAWSTPDTSSNQKPAPLPQSGTNDFGWGSGSSLASQSIVPGATSGFSTISTAPPKVSADEDFGGWSSSAPISPGTNSTAAKPKPGGGFGASEDLFSNVWQ